MNGKPGMIPINLSRVKLTCSSAIDTLKGSFYANPIIDLPTVPDSDKSAYPEYYRDNICQYTCHRCFIFDHKPWR